MSLIELTGKQGIPEFLGTTYNIDLILLSLHLLIEIQYVAGYMVAFTVELHSRATGHYSGPLHPMVSPHPQSVEVTCVLKTTALRSAISDKLFISHREHLLFRTNCYESEDVAIDCLHL